MTTEAPIVVRNLVKRYGTMTAVNRVSLSIRPGAILGLLGANGAGKTTTIRMILDIIHPDEGEVLVFGEQVNARNRDRIGYLPEERGLYGKMTVGDYLSFMGRLRQMQPALIRAEADKWLARLDLLERKKSPISELSKGNQQKVQLIATILHDPEVLILDEPFSGLDPVNRHAFEEIVLEKRRLGRALLFSTHVLEQAERLLDDVIMLRKGEAVVDGALADVKRSFGTGWVEVRGEDLGRHLDVMVPSMSRIAVNDGGIRIRMSSRDEARELLGKLVSRGASLDRFQLLEASLNDIFLERVGGINRGLDENSEQEAGA